MRRASKFDQLGFIGMGPVLLTPQTSGGGGGPINASIGDNTGNTYSGLHLVAINSADADTPLGGEVSARVNSNSRFGLIRAPGAASISGTASLTTSAGTGTRLRLYKSAANTQTPEVAIQTLKVSFVTNEATWNSRSTGVSWATAGALGGADYDGTTLASLTVADTTGYVEFYGSALTTAVQNIINEVAGYAGLKVLLLTAFNDAFFASHAGTDGQRPELYVVGTVA